MGFFLLVSLFTRHSRLKMPYQVGLNAICAERRRLGAKGASVMASRALLKCLEAALHSQSQESLLMATRNFGKLTHQLREPVVGRLLVQLFARVFLYIQTVVVWNFFHQQQIGLVLVLFVCPIPPIQQATGESTLGNNTSSQSHSSDSVVDATWQFGFTAYDIDVTISHDFVAYITHWKRGEALGKFTTDKGQTKNHLQSKISSRQELLQGLLAEVFTLLADDEDRPQHLQVVWVAGIPLAAIQSCQYNHVTVISASFVWNRGGKGDDS